MRFLQIKNTPSLLLIVRRRVVHFLYFFKRIFVYLRWKITYPQLLLELLLLASLSLVLRWQQAASLFLTLVSLDLIFFRLSCRVFLSFLFFQIRLFCHYKETVPSSLTVISPIGTPSKSSMSNILSITSSFSQF